MSLDFIKMNACGNDFLIVDFRSQKFDLTKNNIVKLADYKRSIGFDQFLVIDNSPIADVGIRIFNQDGSEAEACGNGTRCVARLILEALAKQEITIATVNRVLSAKWKNNLVVIDMGKAEIVKQNINLMENVIGDLVNIGNPHIIIKANLDPATYGPVIENSSLFPTKVNVNFANIINRDFVEIATWERGVGLTLSCGTGACATFFLLYSQELVNKEVIIKQPGGNLTVSIENGNIFMAGEANINYRGKIW